MRSSLLAIGAILVAIAATAAASALGGTTNHGAATTTSSTSFVLRFLGTTGYVDNAPKSPTKGGFPTRMSPGDVFLAHSFVYDSTNTRRLGRTSEICTVTVPRPLTFDCSMALLFADKSEILVHGALNPTQPGWSAPVVGGKGQYAGAGGSVTISDFKSRTPAERWTFDLIG